MLAIWKFKFIFLKQSLYFVIRKFKQNFVTYNNGSLKSWNSINMMSNIIKNFKWKIKRLFGKKNKRICMGKNRNLLERE